MASIPGDDPSITGNLRFTTPSHSVEDRLKADTVGLVQLSDFRKRRAEALEAANDGTSSGATTPDDREPVARIAFKKKKAMGAKRGGLSFAGDDEETDGSVTGTRLKRGNVESASPNVSIDEASSTEGIDISIKKKSLRPNAAIALQPRALTKSALQRETALKEALKKEYVQMQEAVKATEFILPFVFYDGKNVSGGRCRMKKGDPIWLFLDRARKVGADLAGRGDFSKRDWARISVDDLMVVRGDIIIPHHYDFHYFLINKSRGYRGPLFTYAAEPTDTTPKHLLPNAASSRESTPADAADDPSIEHLQTAAQRKQQAVTAQAAVPLDSALEGFDDDPAATKVVDRRWYERNKHIYPASSWEDFDPNKDYSSDVRKDPGGNTMFFSR